MLGDLVFALAQRGFRVEVISSRLDYATGRRAYPPADEIGGVTIHRVWTTAYGRASLVKRSLDYLSFYVAATWRAAARLRAGDTIVVKTDPPLLAVPVGVVARIKRARHVNWLQDIFPEIAEELGVRGISGPAGRALKWARNATLRSAAANVVLGESMAGRLRALGAPDTLLHVIPNWTDTRAVYPVPHGDNHLRAAWGLSDKFVVCHSGNLGRAHDASTILDAAQRLADQDDIRFVFVGGGYLYDRLRAAALDQALGNMLFKPYQRSADLAFSLSAADVHLSALAPQLEGLLVPSKIYAVAAAGRPIVHIGGTESEVAALAANAGWGCSVAQGDGAGLARTVLALRDDPEACAVMGRAGRGLAEAALDRSVAVERWAGLLSPAPVRASP